MGQPGVCSELGLMVKQIFQIFFSSVFDSRRNRFFDGRCEVITVHDPFRHLKVAGQFFVALAQYHGKKFIHKRHHPDVSAAQGLLAEQLG